MGRAPVEVGGGGRGVGMAHQKVYSIFEENYFISTCRFQLFVYPFDTFW